jgi:hypothetical protein
MESINKIQNDEVKELNSNKPKNQSVEGQKVYKTRNYVQSDIAKENAEKRRLRDQYLIDHKEEILKYDGKSRIKKVIEMIKQDLNLDVNYKTIYPIINKYVLTDVKNQNAEARKLRDQYLKDHREEILKLDHWNKVKKVNELLKKDLNLDVNYNKLYLALTKLDLL